MHLVANLLDPRYCGQKLSEDDLMTAIETVIEIAKNSPDINEVTVMSNIAENTRQNKNSGIEKLFGKLPVIYLQQLSGKVIAVQENYLGL